MVEFDDVRRLVIELLHLDDRTEKFGPDTPLLGSVPEFDSIAVIALLKAMEDRFGIQVADDEISAEDFETVGRVYEFVQDRMRVAAGV
ncbi:MAG: acyl carrier protein [Candidatus Competibacteraceae bacterium]|nr:acyl carrier protein [Candidatus Competibacteraceae bacterium]MBK7982266.1 acyl carrier protein [Candidatus Competibacteraceae bacterium]MBK8899184.1 acyl carrier protein [Candidatus Competibacteraceae bacterium]MBK8963221.1 acyl carrier protein [Candidatus Competibacteraceae bacterium]MBK9952185.1 acyl carrier protein [Candidatus Competibacteraceae bacterium]